MSLNASSLVAVSYPTATEIARQINGASISADLLCRAAVPYPIAIELARQMHAGTGDVGALHRAGFAASDATAIAGAITAAGARA